MGSISKNFSWNEFEKTSYVGLQEKNLIPNDEVRSNIRALVDNILQPLRDALGYAVIVNSGYRCKEVNEMADGKPNSQHLSGSASDIRTGNDLPYDLAKEIVSLALPYDQLILYNKFVHVSYNNGGRQRGQLIYDPGYKGTRF